MDQLYNEYLQTKEVYYKEIAEQVNEEGVNVLYFQGRKDSCVRNKLQRTVLRDLLEVLVSSIAAKEAGISDDQSELFYSDEYLEDIFMKLSEMTESDDLHFMSFIIKIFSTLYYRFNQKFVENIISRIKKVLKSLKEYDNVDSVSFASNAFKFFYELMEHKDYAGFIAKKVFNRNSLSTI